MDVRNGLLTRRYSSGRQDSATLEVGPNGFAVATIAGSVVVTEVPNLTIGLLKKAQKSDQKKGAVLKSSKKKRRKAQQSDCLLYTSPSPRDGLLSRMPSSA